MEGVEKNKKRKKRGYPPDPEFQPRRVKTNARKCHHRTWPGEKGGQVEPYKTITCWKNVGKKKNDKREQMEWGEWEKKHWVRRRN